MWYWDMERFADVIVGTRFVEVPAGAGAADAQDRL